MPMIVSIKRKGRIVKAYTQEDFLKVMDKQERDPEGAGGVD
jgi:hypothetical protein